MVGLAASGSPCNTRSILESIMLLLASGIGSGVMVLPRAMAAAGPTPMIILFIIGWGISSLTTWILFRAMAESRNQPDVIMSISSRLLSASSHTIGLISPQALGAEPGPEGSPSGGKVMERKRSTSFLDYKDRKSRESAHPVDRVVALPGPSYGDLVDMVLFKRLHGMNFLDVVLLVHQQLALTVYFLFISQFVEKLPLISAWLPWPWLVILIVAVPATKLAQLESVGKLARVASISPAILLFMMFGVIYRWFYPDPHMALPDFSQPSDPSTYPAVMCIAVFSYMWHTNCVTVARELRDPSQFRCIFVVLMSTTILLFAYTTLAFFGYKTFGQELRKVPTIIMLYSASDPLFIAIRFSLSISLFVAIPLNVYPVRESVLAMIKTQCGQQAHDDALQYQDFLSAILVVVPALCAICFPYVTQIITILGGSLVSFLMIVFPVLIGQLVLPEWLAYGLLAVTCPFVMFLIVASLGYCGHPI